jgi:acetyl-CoA synthetase
MYRASEEFVKNAHINSEREYEEVWKRSVEDPDSFWREEAERMTWFRKPQKIAEGRFEECNVKWFADGKLNLSYNCVDRHIEGARKNKAAIIWEAEDGESRIYTYCELLNSVCKFTNLLKSCGVKKGDRVCFYLPQIPELAIGVLACARIGAIHSVVFGGFSADSLKERINDCAAKVLVTADGGFRRGKVVLLKENADKALKDCPTVERCIVIKRTYISCAMVPKRDIWYDEAIKEQSSSCEPEVMDAEDPLFILYTSGSTGKPKGLLHTSGGYIVYAATTFRYIFDYREEDTYWCTADIGWITGHSYIVYGPLANGATTVMFEGVPNFPAPDRYWKIVERYKVNIFYTAPTVIRALAKEGVEWTEKCDLSSLRLLGSVGEPINPEAWLWYYKHIGKERCPIVDTWWQTETGGILIAPLPGAMALKPGSASRPFFGIKPAIVKDGKDADVNEEGALVITAPWPGIARTIWGDHERYKKTYFSQYPGRYFTGDGAKRDEDGDFWLLGRIDDVINVSGHRLGTAEVESALVAHSAVAEAAVVGFPHDIKGEGIYAFVVLNEGVEPSSDLQKELVAQVRKAIGPIAKPDRIQFAKDLPKTRSGKIMRRILRKIAKGDTEDIGDTTTLADPGVVQRLIEGAGMR